MIKNRQNLIIISLCVLSIALSVYVYTQSISKNKIAYVRSTELVYGYLGMQDAHDKFEQKSAVWKANIDTLGRNYKAAVEKFQSEESTLSDKEKQQQEMLLQKQEQSLIGYEKAIDEKSKEEDNKMTEAVLNQVNSFVADYGKSHGYYLIFGTTTSGNLLYGEDALDITNEVLVALNKNYKGE